MLFKKYVHSEGIIFSFSFLVAGDMNLNHKYSQSTHCHFDRVAPVSRIGGTYRCLLVCIFLHYSTPFSSGVRECAMYCMRLMHKMLCTACE